MKKTMRRIFLEKVHHGDVSGDVIVELAIVHGILIVLGKMPMVKTFQMTNESWTGTSIR